MNSLFTRLVICVLLAFTAAPAVAQTPDSTTQMKLVTSTTFLNRLVYSGVKVMKEVLEEPATANASSPIPAYTSACHTRRGQYAQNFLLSTDSYAAQAAKLIVSANYAGAVIVGSVINRAAVPETDAPLWDSSVSDGALEQAFRIFMNTFAGCVINAGS